MINGLGQLISRPAVSVYCYKVSVDRETRPGWSAVATGDGIPRLPLKMHLLIAAWGGNAEEELRWLGLVGPDPGERERAGRADAGRPRGRGGPTRWSPWCRTSWRWTRSARRSRR